MKYGLFLGCAVPTRLPFVEAATHYVLERLEIEATALQDMACCMDPIVLKSLSHDAWLTVAARNLSVVADQGCDAIQSRISLGLSTNPSARHASGRSAASR